MFSLKMVLSDSDTLILAGLINHSKAVLVLTPTAPPEVWGWAPDNKLVGVREA